MNKRRIAGIVVLFFISALYCAAQTASQRGRIAILSFNGGSPDERDGIAEIFSFTPQIMQNFTVIPRTTIVNAISREQNFQYSSGMTDADTMARLGNQFGADYVMAGSITSLGSSNLLIVSVVKIDVIQQVAGDFIIYNTLDDLVRNQSTIHKMAENLISIMQKDTKNMQRLAVVPVQFSGDVNRANGDALAQLLSVHLIRNGKYAVFPRTQSLEQVQREYSNQTSGTTRDSQRVAIGRGINPEYVLSIVSRRIGSLNTFNASVIDLEGGYQVDGVSEQYANLPDGINAMDFIARQLSGVQVSERERSRRTSNVSSAADRASTAREREATAAEREAAAARRANARRDAADKFLDRSSIIVDGWLGIENAKFSGGFLLGWRFGYFGLQTGLNFMGTEYVVPIPDVEDIRSTMLQLPVLARATIPFFMYYISPYAGVGFNLLSESDNRDIEVQSLSDMSIIAGIDLGLSMVSVTQIRLFLGFQYNGDIDDTVIKYYGANDVLNDKFKNQNFSITMGVSLGIPLRRNYRWR